MESETSLSFFELTRRLNAMPEFEAATPASQRRAKLGFAVSIVAFCVAFLITRIGIPASVQIVVLYALLASEIAGICINIWNSRSEFYDLREPLNNFARQLDHDLPHHYELVDWLARQPTRLLERHASMAQFRRERFNQKLPLVAGNIPTLGILPVVVAIYLQAREYAASRHLSWIDFLAGLAIALIYVLTWMVALMKSRLEAMDMYLRIALDQKRSSPSTGRSPVLPVR
ncbi:hypothetical protein J2T07_003762 [Luteibacter jiangsuensis]|uniref:Uncharacterized protein n=1 Tax=Luteibacter jiangsuensis TaxID=637577 RepID=A0ABT9T2Q1_9GAMM|nr:hypothetical protein [Luteibacter jiangsuensis]MDQ0011548.1 hypothetical protein [Luteibacter jiangsuensis]